MFIDPSGFVASYSDFIAANKMQQVLMRSLDIGNKFLSALDKVDATISVVDSIWTTFKIVQNPVAAGWPLSSTLDFNRLLFKLPNLEDAMISLRANTGRIVSGVLYRKIPMEMGKFKKFMGSNDSSYVLLLPSLVTLPKSIPTGLKIYKKPLEIDTNEYKDRLFGISMYDTPNDKLHIFRQDYGKFNHKGGADAKNWDVWKDGDFHYHIIKS